ncbi:alpha/beta hydrolase [Allomuricauda sp. SCSIO 65647]|uniref:alpha/beta hydrolase n=1 Tax=Allomuricauda sp. SCSIO 65647 TaxID=2908843 RepID=UPI001F2D6A6D|nr:alpha/beta hydrolase [Muricauda sp. SCSIO 65647]UJH66837.1 alpha/beta hydrolase [Muricauda sp. SCSIO 65647]
MKYLAVVIGLFLALSSFSQEIIELPNGNTEDIVWENDEKEYFSTIWQTQVVTNVSVPTIQVFRPSEATNNGTAVIVAPGGGLYALSINSEGNDVAKWLNEKGITAFVLKYRLVPTGEDGVGEISQLSMSDPKKIGEEVAKVIPISIQDGLNAIAHVRENAATYGVNPNKIGFMGFSAGGAVTMGVAYNYNEKSKPNFLVPVYAWTDVMAVQTPKSDVPPMVIICATDDPLGLAKGSVELYNSMLKANKPVALHMYAKGGHGFGMKKQNLPSDQWIERFYEWSVAQGITEPKQ